VNPWWGTGSVEILSNTPGLPSKKDAFSPRLNIVMADGLNAVREMRLLHNIALQLNIDECVVKNVFEAYNRVKL